ncbi:unnamed protein product [Periconia digitata]|uniref:Intradiol ring-cleavage dioxygenases domain-containing protein n=1 Tax=Periconia digitata TaxID=1303443 RepID=A0A9W4XPN1_9PLEO|nr:unnamed protein product [Periconia digitata]
MKSTIVSAVLASLLLVQQSVAHPGQSAAEAQAEIRERAEYMSKAAPHKRSLAHCAAKLKARNLDAARRAAKVEALREKRAITQNKPFLRARDFEDVLNTDHHSNLTVTPESDPSELFTGNASCILTPETTEGPYWVQGELIRQDIVDGEAGVPMTLDVQVVDVNTCEPVPQVFTEIWHCNSTGVYGGVVANGNGNTDDEANLDNTMLRGVQLTDKDGVVSFDTLFPGHYTGRATHIHVMTHVGAQQLPNNTVAGGNITHVGQIFFDQDLITLAEQQEPYLTNTQTLTTNADDFIMAEEAENVDPVVDYVLLGDDISQGIFAWIAFGMDATANQSVTPAVYYTENGGVKNPNGVSGPPGGAAPSGFMPSGAMPSGTAIPSAALESS